MSVRLVKPNHTVITYDAVVLADDGNHVVVRAPWAEPEARDLGFVTFEPGDMFTEHYWRDRWYAVKEIRAATGALKGWYTDVARPARVEPGAIVSEDMDLDLWVSADRRMILRLDEDEFDASGWNDVDPDAARVARDALDDLARRAAHDWDALLDD